jgi:hypothetical protein
MGRRWTIYIKARKVEGEEFSMNKGISLAFFIVGALLVIIGAAHRSLSVRSFPGSS